MLFNTIIRVKSYQSLYKNLDVIFNFVYYFLGLQSKDVKFTWRRVRIKRGKTGVNEYI